MHEAVICDPVRTPIGRYGGAIALGQGITMIIERV